MRYLAISFWPDEGDPAASRGWPALSGVADGAPSVRILRDPSGDDIGWAIGRLLDGDLLSVSVLREMPPAEKNWIFYEWRDCLITDTELAELTGVDAESWLADTRNDRYYIWRPVIRDVRDAGAPSPAVLSSTSDFAEYVTSAEPAGVLIDPAAVDLDDAATFRGYSASRHGGSSALMSLSGAVPDATEVFLRNPAALELDDISGQDTSLASLRHAGMISVRAIGLGASRSQEEGFADFHEPELAWRAWADRSSHPSPFWILLELSAQVDPRVIIPTGSIFEQRSLNGVQTLATSVATTSVVDPGRPIALAVPAWCLNQQLAPPGGQQVRATPLRARYRADTSQGDVWRDRARFAS
jgi:hypothetical protein